MSIVVVGGGLAGLCAAHTALDLNKPIILIEKLARLGGNSAKASSGINGTKTVAQARNHIQDSPEELTRDTKLSAKHGPQDDEVLAVFGRESETAIPWLENKFGIDLSLVTRLGGHSHARTHRGGGPPPGFAITSALIKALEKRASQSEPIQIVTSARVTGLLTSTTEPRRVIGVRYQDESGSEQEIEAQAVVLTAGGYAADFTGPDSLLVEADRISGKPNHLTNLPTTNGTQATGDGVKLARAIGADVLGLENVQIHPTGIVDRNAKWSPGEHCFLCPEAFRGVGGLLLDGTGRRFVDELGTRDFVTQSILEAQPPYWIVLSDACATDRRVMDHVKFFTSKGLITPCDSVEALATALNVDGVVLMEQFETYNAGAANNKDAFGRSSFDNTPIDLTGKFHALTIHPVVHYCMGGLRANANCQVLDTNQQVIPGLFVAGETMGMLHGENRLGGNSLLECVVFGRVAAENAAKA